MGGVPQHRPRLYISALRRAGPVFEWPDKIPAQLLDSIMDKQMKKPIKDMKAVFPDSNTSKRSVTACLGKLESALGRKAKVTDMKDCAINDQGTNLS